MEAICWSDYLCPWCYVGQSRSALLEQLGVTLTHLPYELHPEIGPAGAKISPRGRLAPTFQRVQKECESIGLEWRAPTRMPNTRRALETAELVRTRYRGAFDELHRLLFDAHFAQGLELDDPEVIDSLVHRAGAPIEEVRSALDAREGAPLLAQSHEKARALGVSSTPTWVLDNEMVIPGALDAVTLERWIRRIQSRQLSNDS